MFTQEEIQSSNSSRFFYKAFQPASPMLILKWSDLSIISQRISCSPSWISAKKRPHFHPSAQESKDSTLRITKILDGSGKRIDAMEHQNEGDIKNGELAQQDILILEHEAPLDSVHSSIRSTAHGESWFGDRASERKWPLQGEGKGGSVDQGSSGEGKRCGWEVERGESGEFKKGSRRRHSSSAESAIVEPEKEK